MSFGHLISGSSPGLPAGWRARSAVAEATVSCVVSCGRNSGRSSTENQSPFRVGRHPLASQPAPASGLRLGEHHHAFLHAVARQLFDHVIGRGRFLENPDVAADDLRPAQARQQIIRVQHVRRAQQAVTTMRAGLDVVAELAQLLDARPDGRAADAQLQRQAPPRTPRPRPRDEGRKESVRLLS